MDKILQMVKKNLPPPGTELADYTFLGPDALWMGTVESQRHFVVAAENVWSGGGGLLLIVMEDGPVRICKLDRDDIAQAEWRCSLEVGSDRLVDYCGADFQKFMEIMHLYLAALEANPCPDVFDGQGYEKCAEAAENLRRQIQKIDPATIENTESFWSIAIEEFGNGM